jgi:hypothetical protein
VVRADLRDAINDVPAAWAVLEVDGVGDRPWRGVADARGSVLVLCPYPEPRWNGSSPPVGSQALSEQRWPVTLTVRYAAGATGGSGAAVAELCSILNQPVATLLSSSSPVSLLPAQTLTYGHELILRSGDSSVLFVMPT